MHQACVISQIALYCWLWAAEMQRRAWRAGRVRPGSILLQAQSVNFILKGRVQSHFVLESIFTHSMEEARLEGGTGGRRAQESLSMATVQEGENEDHAPASGTGPGTHQCT